MPRVVITHAVVSDRRLKGKATRAGSIDSGSGSSRVGSVSALRQRVTRNELVPINTPKWCRLRGPKPGHTCQT